MNSFLLMIFSSFFCDFSGPLFIRPRHVALWKNNAVVKNYLASVIHAKFLSKNDTIQVLSGKKIRTPNVLFRKPPLFRIHTQDTVQGGAFFFFAFVFFATCAFYLSPVRFICHQNPVWKFIGFFCHPGLGWKFPVKVQKIKVGSI